jgi:hypothetical protein
MRPEPSKSERVNPLDEQMTKAQVVRRKFKSALPRTILNRRLEPLEAMAFTMQLFDKFRGEMDAAGLKKSDVEAGLVYCQPETKGKELIAAETKALPAPEAIGTFATEVMALHKPMFLGVIFLQRDHETDKPEKKNTIFVWPFMDGPEANKRLLAARKQQAAGGFKKIAN